MWIIQPLLDAGLDLEQITGLVFRLGFEGVVAEGAAVDPAHLVRDQTPWVQAAWRDAVGRMLVLDLDGATDVGTPVELS